MPITRQVFAQRGRERVAALGIDPARLPPGQSPTVKWPVLSLGESPYIPMEHWTLTVDGRVEEPFTLDWDAFLAEPQQRWHGDIHCVTRWSKFDMDWEGVDVSALIARARPRPEASHLMAHCYGGYTTNMPLSDVLEHPAFIAHRADGVALERDHGGPARLLVPHLYLWKSGKWIRRLELLDEDQLGFWERNGYHHRGDPWREERYSVPEYMAKLRRRELRAQARGEQP